MASPNPTYDAVCNRARALLNDTAGQKFTNTKLLEYAQEAVDELVDVLLLNGCDMLGTASAAITVTAGTTSLDYTSGLPADVENPYLLEEKAVGAADSTYVPMHKPFMLPRRDPDSVLGVWIWEEQKLKFIGATQDRAVRISYQKGVPVLTGAGAQEIPINRSRVFLGAKTGALAALLVDQNETRALAIHEEAQMAMTRLVAWYVKQLQLTPVRRRAWRRPSRRRFLLPRRTGG